MICLTHRLPQKLYKVMTITNNIVAKLAVAFVAVAMAFTLAAPSVKAQDVSSMSLEQLIALVNQLQGQLTGSTAATGSCSFTFTRSLGTGSTGADVMNLQKFLNTSADTQVAAAGAAGGPGTETSYYGPATAAAVSKFQTKYSAEILVPSGLTTPTGYFGPASMAKANALCSTGGSTGGNTGGTTGGLQGGAGNLADADFISSINNEEVGEDQDDVEVVGLELEADNGSDLRLTSVRVEFELATGQSGSDDFDDYAEEVTIWLDGDQVGSVDVDDMSESRGVWSSNVAIDNSAVIKRGKTADLTVAVSALRKIDTTDLNNNLWEGTVGNIRYVDAQGAVITESNVGDIGNTRNFEFASFSSANDVRLTLSESTDNPDAGTVQVDEDGGDEVPLLIGEFEARGSDIELSDLTVDITSTGTGDIVDQAARFILVIDGDDVDSVDADECDDNTCTTSEKYTFNDIDFVVEEGDTVEFEVRVELNEIDGTDFVQGDGLTASITANATYVKAEDESGKDLVSGDIKGGATGELQKFASTGIMVNMTSSSASQVLGLDTTSADDQGKYVMEFEVTAFEDTAYVQLTAGSSTDAAGGDFGVAFSIENTADAVQGGGSITGAVLERISGGTTAANNTVRINASQTAKFRLTVYYDAAATGIYRVQMNQVGYNDTAAAADVAQALTPTANYQSESVQVQN